MLQNIEFLLYIKECRSVMPFGLGNCKSTRQLCNDIQGLEEIKRKFYGCFTEKLNTCWDIQTRKIQAFFLSESHTIGRKSIDSFLLSNQANRAFEASAKSLLLEKSLSFQGQKWRSYGAQLQSGYSAWLQCSIYIYISIYCYPLTILTSHSLLLKNNLSMLNNGK